MATGNHGHRTISLFLKGDELFIPTIVTIYEDIIILLTANMLIFIELLLCTKH